MIPIFIADTHTRVATNDTSCNAALPTGLADEDVMLLIAFDTAASAIVTPTGWTEIATSPIEIDVGATRLRTFWKIASSEGASIDLTKGAAAHWFVYIAAYRGVHQTTPIINSQCSHNESGPSSVSTGLIAAATDIKLVFYAMSVNGDTFSEPAGWTLLQNSGAAEGEYIVAEKDFSAGGDTGTITAAMGTSSTSANVLIALQPPAVLLAVTNMFFSAP